MYPPQASIASTTVGAIVPLALVTGNGGLSTLYG